MTATALTIGPLGVWTAQTAASAVAAESTGTPTCRASALRVDPELPAPLDTLPTVEPVVANADNDPCVAEDAGVLNDQALPGDLGTADVLFARTGTADGSSSAQAGVADITITVPGAPVIRAEVLTSQAQSDCTSGQPELSSSSTVARVTIGTTVIEPVAEPVEIPLGEVGTLFLNQQTFSAEDGSTTDNTVTQRALFLDTLVADVVVAESIADFRGNPCGPPTASPGASPSVAPSPGRVPECRDGRDNDGDGRVDFPDDPGCSNSEDDSEKDNGRPNDPGSDVPECSDEIDNDGDGTIDFPNDSGCASPQDDDERSTGNEPQCSDGMDNDADTRTDYPSDPGCDSREDDDEQDQAGECADTRDNDVDGRSDFPADNGCKSAGDDDEADGFINGGGGYDEVDKKTAPEDTVTPGERLRFGATLPCDLGEEPGPNLVTTFLGEGNEAQFKLDELTRAFCRNDPFIDPRNPGTEFDTYVGEGTGTLRLGGQDLPARAEFILIDRGEPGSPPEIGVDVYQIRVFVGVVEVANGCCTLDEGNIQAHSGGGGGGGSSSGPETAPDDGAAEGPGKGKGKGKGGRART